MENVKANFLTTQDRKPCVKLVTYIVSGFFLLLELASKTYMHTHTAYTYEKLGPFEFFLILNVGKT